MKFNRKVYVVPEEKYLNMLQDLKLRAEVAGGVPQLPPTQPSKSTEEPTPILREGVSEVTGAPDTHPPESGGTDVEQKSKGTAGDNTDEVEPISGALGNDDVSKKNLTKVQSLLAPYKGGKGGSKNFTAALLHTQSTRYPLPQDYKTFYSILLEKNIPLELIGNKRLRRVLHYLKNLRGDEKEIGKKKKKKRQERGNSDSESSKGRTSSIGKARGKIASRSPNIKGSVKSVKRSQKILPLQSKRRGKQTSKGGRLWVKL